MALSHSAATCSFVHFQGTPRAAGWVCLGSLGLRPPPPTMVPMGYRPPRLGTLTPGKEARPRSHLWGHTYPHPVPVGHFPTHPGNSLQEEGPGHSLAPGVGAVEQRVEVGQQRVTQGEGRPHGSLSRITEPVGLLRLQGEAGVRGSTWAPGDPTISAGQLLVCGLRQGVVPGRPSRPPCLPGCAGRCGSA